MHRVTAKLLLLIALSLGCSGPSSGRPGAARPDTAKAPAQDSTAGAAADSTDSAAVSRAADSGSVAEAPPTPATVAVAPAPPPAAATPSKPDVKPIRGYYRTGNDSTLFQVCGDPRWYPVDGFWMAVNKLREEYKWSSVYLGRPKFVAVQGYFIEDTVHVAGDSSAEARPEIRRRIYVAQLDTVRARSDTDCRGSRSSRAR